MEKMFPKERLFFSIPKLKAHKSNVKKGKRQDFRVN